MAQTTENKRNNKHEYNNTKIAPHEHTQHESTNTKEPKTHEDRANTNIIKKKTKQEHNTHEHTQRATRHVRNTNNHATKNKNTTISQIQRKQNIDNTTHETCTT